MLVGLLLAGCAGSSGDSYQPVTVVEPRAVASDAPRGEALLQRTAIEGHNLARKMVGVPPLVWDDKLADHARAYAAVLARTGKFQHAEQPMGPGREGENLFIG